MATGFHLLKEMSMDKKRNSSPQLRRVMHPIQPTQGMLFGVLILGALLAFELFNYSTTDFALSDLLGDLRFLDLRWATILALAFCAIDFAGLARLFTPPSGASQPGEVWYLFAAWLLAATMNAMLTWWGVAMAILSHTSLGAAIVSQETMLEVVPVFVAIMVWVIRVLIIGTFSVAGNRIFSQAELTYQAPDFARLQPLPLKPVTNQPAPFQHISRRNPKPTNQSLNHGEPTSHPATMASSDQKAHEIRK
jgi:hypothetical protein